MKRLHPYRYRRPIVIKLDSIDPNRVNGSVLETRILHQADYIFYENNGTIKVLKNRCGFNGEQSIEEHVDSLEQINKNNILPLGRFIL